jgi:hypothetical protein
LAAEATSMDLGNFNHSSCMHLVLLYNYGNHHFVLEACFTPFMHYDNDEKSLSQSKASKLMLKDLDEGEA